MDESELHSKIKKKSINNSKSTENKQYIKCLHLMRYILSNFGLALTVVLYALGGAYLFIFIEKLQRKQLCLDVQGDELNTWFELKEKLIFYIYNNISIEDCFVSNKTSKDNEENANIKIENWLMDLAINTTIKNYLNNYYDGADCNISKWFFSNSFLFAITIITSIGKKVFYFHLFKKLTILLIKRIWPINTSYRGRTNNLHCISFNW